MDSLRPESHILCGTHILVSFKVNTSLRYNGVISLSFKTYLTFIAISYTHRVLKRLSLITLISLWSSTTGQTVTEIQEEEEERANKFIIIHISLYVDNISTLLSICLHISVCRCCLGIIHLVCIILIRFLTRDRG